MNCLYIDVVRCKAPVLANRLKELSIVDLELIHTCLNDEDRSR